MFNHKGDICIGNASGETLTQRGQLRIHFILADCEMNDHVVSCFRNFVFELEA